MALKTESGNQGKPDVGWNFISECCGSKSIVGIPINPILHQLQLNGGMHYLTLVFIPKCLLGLDEIYYKLGKSNCNFKLQFSQDPN